MNARTVGTAIDGLARKVDEGASKVANKTSELAPKAAHTVGAAVKK